MKKSKIKKSDAIIIIIIFALYIIGYAWMIEPKKKSYKKDDMVTLQTMSSLPRGVEPKEPKPSPPQGEGAPVHTLERMRSPFLCRGGPSQQKQLLLSRTGGASSYTAANLPRLPSCVSFSRRATARVAPTILSRYKLCFPPHPSRPLRETGRATFPSRGRLEFARFLASP